MADLLDSTPLDATRSFIAEVLYAKAEVIDALALVMAVSHATDAFTTVPRVLVTAEQPGAGKTTVLDLAMMLAGNPLDGNGTAYGIKSAFIDNDGRPSLTIVRDEIHHIFGKNGMRGGQNPLYDPLLRGYRASAKHIFSSGQSAQQVSIYGVAFMAGLGNAVPGDLMSRSIHLSMEMKPESVELQPSDDESVTTIGLETGSSLHAWVRGNAKDIKQLFRRTSGRRLHPKLVNRRAQIWAPLFSIALVAGGSWPQRCREAFEYLALDTSDRPVLTPPERCLLDLAAVFRADPDREWMSVPELWEGLLLRPTSPELYEKLSPKALYNLMSVAVGRAEPEIKKVEGKAQRVRYAADVLDLAASLERKLQPEDISATELEEWEVAMYGE